MPVGDPQPQSIPPMPDAGHPSWRFGESNPMARPLLPMDQQIALRLVEALERLAQPPDVAGIIRETLAGLKPLLVAELPEPKEPLNLFESAGPLAARYPLEPQAGDPAWELPEIVPDAEREVAEREAAEG